MEKQDMQRIIEMLEKLVAKQEKAAADRKADNEEMEANIKSWREKIAAETEAIKGRTRVIQENMGTSHKEMVAVIEPRRNMETIACQEMEAHPEEEKPTSMDRKPEAAEEEEVPVEDAVVKPVNGRKKRHRGKKQAAERCEEPEQHTRGTCATRRKLAAACRKVSQRATGARRRREAFKKDRTQDGCQRRLAAACRGTSHRVEVARQMKADKKMPVARQWHDA
jgi:hypothetical protein